MHYDKADMRDLRDFRPPALKLAISAIFRF